jgi:hypothetical protein
VGYDRMKSGLVMTIFSVTIRDFVLSYSSIPVGESPLTYHSELLIDGDLASNSKWIASKMGIYKAQPYCTSLFT